MMFLPLPKSFDENEWFVIFSILVFLIVFIILPKRFSRITTVMILLFNCVLSKTADYTIAASLPFDLYDYNDTYKLDLFDEFLQYGLYPLAAYLFVYWYDVWEENKFNRFFYLLLAVPISVLYEWLSDQAHVFTYKGWRLWYSGIAYVILLTTNMYLLYLLKKWLPKRKADNRG